MFHESASSFAASTEVTHITPAQLAHMLSCGLAVVVIDVRSVLEYEQSHIHGAVRTACGSALLQRRLAKGKATVAEVLSDQGRAVFESRAAATRLVVHDRDSTWLSLQDNSMMSAIVNALVRAGEHVLFLHGGFAAMQHHAPAWIAFPAAEEQTALQFHPHCMPGGDASSHAVVASRRRVPVGPLSLSSAARATAAAPAPAAFAALPHVPETPTMSQVLPHLYLGSRGDAADRALLDAHGIRFVVNITTDCPNYHAADPAFSYLQIPLLDTWNQNIAAHFEEVCAFVEAARIQGGAVLVHCAAGVSRSSTMVIAYLMRVHGWSLNHSYAHVKAARSVIAPNLDFMGHLLQYERQLGIHGSPLSVLGSDASPNASPAPVAAAAAAPAAARRRPALLTAPIRGLADIETAA